MDPVLSEKVNADVENNPTDPETRPLTETRSSAYLCGLETISEIGVKNTVFPAGASVLHLPQETAQNTAQMAKIQKNGCFIAE